MWLHILYLRGSAKDHSSRLPAQLPPTREEKGNLFLIGPGLLIIISASHCQGRHGAKVLAPSAASARPPGTSETEAT